MQTGLMQINSPAAGSITYKHLVAAEQQAQQDTPH
jgi:hypothetical protein